MDLEGGIPAEDWKYYHKFDETELGRWCYVSRSTIQCQYCDFAMEYDLKPPRQKIRYRPLNWRNQFCTEYVGEMENVEGVDWYKKRYQLDLACKQHFDNVHGVLPDDWQQDWKQELHRDNLEVLIQCQRCRFPIWMESSCLRYLDFVNRYKKAHRRTCNPETHTHSTWTDNSLQSWIIINIPSTKGTAMTAPRHIILIIPPNNQSFCKHTIAKTRSPTQMITVNQVTGVIYTWVDFRLTGTRCSDTCTPQPSRRTQSPSCRPGTGWGRDTPGPYYSGSPGSHSRSGRHHSAYPEGYTVQKIGMTARRNPFVETFTIWGQSVYLWVK